MQKLIYINLRGDQLLLHQAPHLLSKVSGLEPAALEISTLKGAYQQGDTLTGYRREHRVVDVTTPLIAASREELYALRQQLAAILSPDRAWDGTNCAKLYYTNDHGTWWTYAMPDGVEYGKRVLNCDTSMSMSFRCHCPYWYSVAQRSVEFAYNGDGLSFPEKSFPISFGRRDYARVALNGGQMDAPVEVWITGKGETPSLLNVTTGKRIKLTSALANGYVLHVNTDPAQLTATITDTSDAVSSAFGLLDIGSPLTDFVLTAGQNTLKYEPGGASVKSEITVKWYDAFEGV